MVRIIQVAGTMGSGKTTVIRKLLGERDREVWYEGERTLPIGYAFHVEDVKAPVYLVGSYEAAMASGCDTIKDTRYSYDLINWWHKEGYHVIYEGLFMMNHTRGVELHKTTKAVTVLYLTTPLDVCMEGIAARRAAKNKPRTLAADLNKQVRDNNTRATNYVTKMRRAGARVIPVTRDDALAVLIKQLEDQSHA